MQSNVQSKKQNRIIILLFLYNWLDPVKPCYSISFCPLMQTPLLN